MRGSKMKQKQIMTVLRRGLFLLLAVTLLVQVSGILARKSVYGTENDPILLKVGGFWNEPEDSFEVLAFGSSHMYCTLSPVYLYEQTGLRSYVLATQQQAPVATYYYVKEALRRQKPEVIIVEAFMFASDNEKVTTSVAHDAIDPYPNTWNKVLMIQEMNQEDGKESYYVNLMKYHTRWKDLTEEDFTFDAQGLTDPLRGYMFFSNVGESSARQVRYDDVEPVTIRQEHLDYLLKIQELAREHDAQMLLLFAPFPMSDTYRGKFLTLHQFAQEHGIDTLDMNLEFDAMGFDNTTDFCDSSHLNVCGAEKASLCIGSFLMEEYGLTPVKLADEEDWLAGIQTYYTKKDE